MTTTRTRAIVSGTVLVVLALALSVALPAGDVRGEVHPSFDPDVHVQLNASGIDVTWVSAAEEDGFVESALSAADLAAGSGTFSTETDVRGDFASRLNKRTHRVSASGVAGGSTIHYQIVSGGVTIGPFSVTIASTPLTNPPNLLEGFVRYPDSSLGLECIVSMRVTNKEPFGPGSADAHSLWVNDLTNAVGEYVLDITNIRGSPANAFFNNNVDQAFSFATSAAISEITVIARCDAENVGQTVKTTLDAGFSAGYQDFDVQLAPLSPTFSIADVSVGEGTGAATLTISLQPAASASTAVSWATSDDTATAPADYTASSGTVLFAAGVTSKAVRVGHG